METFLTAIITFAATNVDDIFILMLFFSEADASFRRRHIVFGQYLGFIVLILISLLGFFSRFVIPAPWLGLLGIAPIVIGVRKLFTRSLIEEEKTDIGAQAKQDLQPSSIGSLLNPRAYSVAAVTVANGGDNLGIYTPLFASSDLPRLVTIIVIFLVLVAVWCFVGYKLTRQPHVATILSRYSNILVPLVLIGLGVYIFIENGTLALLQR